jgi:broad specificity phosphatase PhoE
VGPAAVILLRHGQTVFNAVFTETRIDPGVADPCLTGLGRDQARAAADALAAEGVRRIVASPYLRALETAEIVADALDVPVSVDVRVRERMAFSCDVGSPRSVLAARWPGWRFDAVEEMWWSESEEPLDSLFARCGAFCAAMAEEDDWRDVAVVTHWGVIRALTGVRAPNGAHLRIDPGAATVPHPGCALVPSPDP